MSRTPSNSAVAVTRRQRKALRAEVERVSQVADQRLAEAVREGLLDLATLPQDTQQRLLVLDGRGLEGRIEGDTVIVDDGGDAV
jgi:hypothetical protein